jgi:adenylylsulfate kinase
MKILIFGLPGSGKSTLAKQLFDLLDAVWLNADDIRMYYDDWDFTKEGRLRQANRMKLLADGVERAGKIALLDFICPTEKYRSIVNADFTIWMDTISSGRFQDTNQIFIPPNRVDYRVDRWCNDTYLQVFERIKEVIK